MVSLATRNRRSAPPRLLAALRRVGVSEEQIRHHYGLRPDQPLPCGPAEPLRVEDMELLPDDGYRYELWEGELVRMSPSKLRHGGIAGRVVGHIFVYLTQNPIGEVYVAEAGFRAGPGESLYCPDAAYLSNERAAAASLDDFGPFAPDIAIEVWSPKNTQRKLKTKADYYLQHGAKRVWIVHPRDKTVRIYRPDAPPQTLQANDTLSGEDVLPGFTVRVGDLFPI